MKKFILTVISVSILFSTSLISIFAADNLFSMNYLKFKETYEDPFKLLFDWEYSILDEYNYDEEVEREATIKTFKHTMREVFDFDIKLMESKKVGGVRQFVNLLLYLLYNDCYNVHLVIVPGSNYHPVLMLKLNGHEYILDPGRSKAWSEFLGTKVETFVIPLEEFWNIFKEYKYIIVIKNYPGEIDKTFKELLPICDYEVIMRPKS